MNMYKEAILSQNAVNSSGLIKSLARHLDAIWEEARQNNGGTEYVNQHPVIRLFAEQIYFLASYKDYSSAHKECEEKGEEI